MYIKIAKIERTVINVTSLCSNLTNKVSLILLQNYSFREEEVTRRHETLQTFC